VPGTLTVVIDVIWPIYEPDIVSVLTEAEQPLPREQSPTFGNETPLLRFRSFCSFFSLSRERGGAVLEGIVHQRVRTRATVARINVFKSC